MVGHNNANSYQDQTNPHCTMDIRYDDNQWHTFMIDWDRYHVKWFVDGDLIHELTAHYVPSPVGLFAYSECQGAPVRNIIQDNFFPAYANMDFNMGAGSILPFYDITNNPITVTVDYIEYKRKIYCDRVVDLVNYRPIGAVSGKPLIENWTPSVVTGGIITAGSLGPYVVERAPNYWWFEADLNLMATESVQLLPGFIADPSTQIGNNNGSQNIHDVFSAQIVDCPTTTDMPEVIEADRMQQAFLDSIVSLYPESDDTTDADSRNDNDMKDNDNESGYQFGVFPNPTSGNATLFYDIPQDARVTIILYNIDEKYVSTLVQGNQMEGYNTVPFNADGLSAGVYIMVMDAGDDTRLIQKLIVTK